MGIKELDNKYSLNKFLKIEEESDVPLEFIGGYIYAKSFSSIKHNKIVGRINAKLDDYLDRKPCEVFSEQIEVLFGENGENTKPDIFVVCRNEEGDFKRKGQSFLTIPSLIFEVVSPSNSRLDTVIKMDLYSTYGVKEYCLVYQEGIIQQYRLNEEYGTYYLNAAYNLDDTYKGYVFDKFSMNLKDIFKNLDF